MTRWLFVITYTLPGKTAGYLTGGTEPTRAEAESEARRTWTSLAEMGATVETTTITEEKP